MTQICFISKDYHFCQCTRVATISCNHKRRNGFDEQLVHILNYKQKYWVLLVGELWKLMAK